MDDASKFELMIYVCLRNVILLSSLSESVNGVRNFKKIFTIFRDYFTLQAVLICRSRHSLDLWNKINLVRIISRYRKVRLNAFQNCFNGSKEERVDTLGTRIRRKLN